MKKLPKVGDRVKLKEGTVPFAGLNPGEIGTVTSVYEHTFSVNNTNYCYPEYWIKVKSKRKKKQVRKEYIISKKFLEALSSVSAVVGDEVIVVVKE